MEHVLDLPAPRAFRIKAVIAFCLIAGAAGWFGHLGFLAWLKSRPEAVVAVHRGVPITRRMQEANKAFRVGFHSFWRGNDMEFRERIDHMGLDTLDIALDEYKANPNSSYPAIVFKKLEAFQRASGRPSNPVAEEAFRQLDKLDSEDPHPGL